MQQFQSTELVAAAKELSSHTREANLRTRNAFAAASAHTWEKSMLSRKKTRSNAPLTLTNETHIGHFSRAPHFHSDSLRSLDWWWSTHNFSFRGFWCDEMLISHLAAALVLCVLIKLAFHHTRNLSASITFNFISSAGRLNSTYRSQAKRAKNENSKHVYFFHWNPLPPDHLLLFNASPYILCLHIYLSFRCQPLRPEYGVVNVDICGYMWWNLHTNLRQWAKNSISVVTRALLLFLSSRTLHSRKQQPYTFNRFVSN